jgi:hypothetical protein
MKRLGFAQGDPDFGSGAIWHLMNEVVPDVSLLIYAL